MPKWSDDIYLGAAKIPFPADPLNPSPMTEGVGPMGRVYIWDMVPLTANATNISAVQAPAGPGNLVLTAGTGTTNRIGSDNAAQIVLDVPRAVVVAGTGGFPMVVSGYDAYGQLMSETFAAAATGKKAFKVISRVLAGAAGTGVSVGTADIFGIPFRIADKGYIASCVWNAGASSVSGVLVADANPATGTTGDVRGTTSVASASDGIKRLVAFIGLSGIQCGPNATRLGVIGVPQYVI